MKYYDIIWVIGMLFCVYFCLSYQDIKESARTIYLLGGILLGFSIMITSYFIQEVYLDEEIKYLKKELNKFTGNKECGKKIF